MSSTPVTVPRNTTSSFSRPGHSPGGAWEHVQARAAGTASTSNSAKISRERHKRIAPILHAFARHAKRGTTPDSSRDDQILMLHFLKRKFRSRKNPMECEAKI